MAKLPAPPVRLTLAAQTRVLPAGKTLWRIYFRGGDHPTNWNDFRFFGPTHARFDHHDPPQSVQSKGILYAAMGPTTCIAEVFQSTRVIDRYVREPWLVGFQLSRDVALLDLTRTWPTRAGASMAIGTGPRPTAQRWSRVIHASYPNLEGLVYASSMHANEPAVALYERCEDAIPSAPSFNRALGDPALLSRLGSAALTLGYGLV